MLPFGSLLLYVVIHIIKCLHFSSGVLLSKGNIYLHSGSQWGVLSFSCGVGLGIFSYSLLLILCFSASDSPFFLPSTSFPRTILQPFWHSSYSLLICNGQQWNSLPKTITEATEICRPDVWLPEHLSCERFGRLLLCFAAVKDFNLWRKYWKKWEILILSSPVELPVNVNRSRALW